MIVSYKWLQTYFDKELPAPEELAEILTMRAFEIEKIEKIGDDYVLDVDVLPNRSHDCLSHRGVAREISVLLKLIFKNEERELGEFEKTENVPVENKCKDICRRYIGRRLENVKVGPSPKWLVDRLEAIGQKSINNIVDATNYVMFDFGQPLHAFDADKVDGGIVIRKAVVGEKITTLDGKEMDLDESVLVIADDTAPLAIAGIKGGKKAEVDENTKNIILEAANFTHVPVRKASRKLNILTDSSKRFENQISPYMAGVAMEEVTALIAEIARSEGDIKVGDVTDLYDGIAKPYKVGVSTGEINRILGAQISSDEVEEIFKRFGFKYERSGGDFIIIVPDERLDLRIKEDLIEEVGRVYGYENIEVQPLDSEASVPINKTFYYINKIRNILVREGYSEVYTYAFTDKGFVETEKPIAQDKGFLRSNLSDGIRKSLDFNYNYADLLALNEIKIFEIGKVFGSDNETTSLCIASKNLKSKKGGNVEKVESVVNVLSAEIGGDIAIEVKDNIVEINFDKLVEKLPEVDSYGDTLETYIGDVKFKTISAYPFVTRDIAVFVPEGVEEVNIKKIISENAGELLVREPKLFDKFEKKNKETGEIEKISYAFKVVFQSHEKTLTDEEVNVIMDKITEALNGKENWEVR